MSDPVRLGNEDGSPKEARFITRSKATHLGAPSSGWVVRPAVDLEVDGCIQYAKRFNPSSVPRLEEARKGGNTFPRRTDLGLLPEAPDEEGNTGFMPVTVIKQDKPTLDAVNLQNTVCLVIPTYNELHPFGNTSWVLDLSILEAAADGLVDPGHDQTSREPPTPDLRHSCVFHALLPRMHPKLCELLRWGQLMSFSERGLRLLPPSAAPLPEEGDSMEFLLAMHRVEAMNGMGTPPRDLLPVVRRIRELLKPDLPSEGPGVQASFMHMYHALFEGLILAELGDTDGAEEVLNEANAGIPGFACSDQSEHLAGAVQEARSGLQVKAGTYILRSERFDDMVRDEEKKDKRERHKRGLRTSPCCGCSKMYSMSELKRCSKCMQQWYCSAECQKEAWPKHKESCKLWAKTLEEASSEDLNGYVSPETSGRCLVEVHGLQSEAGQRLNGKTAMVLRCGGERCDLQLTAVQGGVDSRTPGRSVSVKCANLRPYADDDHLGYLVQRMWEAPGGKYCMLDALRDYANSPEVMRRVCKAVCAECQTMERAQEFAEEPDFTSGVMAILTKHSAVGTTVSAAVQALNCITACIHGMVRQLPQQERAAREPGMLALMDAAGGLVFQAMRNHPTFSNVQLQGSFVLMMASVAFRGPKEGWKEAVEQAMALHPNDAIIQQTIPGLIRQIEEAQRAERQD